MDTATIGGLRLSRLLLGSNPFSGFSHPGMARDERMVRHYTVARTKQALFDGERLGITGLVARTDFHVRRAGAGARLVPVGPRRAAGSRLSAGWAHSTRPGSSPVRPATR